MCVDCSSAFLEFFIAFFDFFECFQQIENHFQKIYGEPHPAFMYTVHFLPCATIEGGNHLTSDRTAGSFISVVPNLYNDMG